MTCVGCGCSELDPCVDDVGATCSWVTKIPELVVCSFCVEAMQREDAEAAAAAAPAPAAALLFDAYGAPVVW